MQLSTLDTCVLSAMEIASPRLTRNIRSAFGQAFFSADTYDFGANRQEANRKTECDMSLELV